MKIQVQLKDVPVRSNVAIFRIKKNYRESVDWRTIDKTLINKNVLPGNTSLLINAEETDNIFLRVRTTDKNYIARNNHDGIFLKDYKNKLKNYYLISFDDILIVNPLCSEVWKRIGIIENLIFRFKIKKDKNKNYANIYGLLNNTEGYFELIVNWCLGRYGNSFILDGGSALCFACGIDSVICKCGSRNNNQSESIKHLCSRKCQVLKEFGLNRTQIGELEKELLATMNSVEFKIRFISFDQTAPNIYSRAETFAQTT